MKSANKVVEHRGVVEEVANGKVKVRIISESACASCHAKGACTASDTKEKVIDAYNINNTNIASGKSVIIQGQQSLGLKAAFFAYILPFIVVVLTLFITFHLTHNEAISGISSLAILVPYYVFIKLISPRLEKSFIFTIKQIIE